MENIDTKKDSAAKKLGEVIVEKSGILNTRHTSEEAADKMRDLGTDVLPVSDDRKLVGMITDKHPDRQAAAHGHDPKIVLVGEQMSREIIYCFEDQNRADADRLMQEKNLRFLPVVDREMRIVGMITREDLKISGSEATPEDKPIPASGISL